MAAFILGWAGLSVHCQVLSFIGASGLSTRTYFCGKFLHGIFSAVLIFMAARLFHLDTQVSQYLATQVGALASLDFHRAFVVSTATSLVLWILLAAFSLKFIL
jgi:hypothetical protein